MKKDVLAFGIIAVVLFPIIFATGVSAELIPWPDSPPTIPLNHPPKNSNGIYENYRNQLEKSRESLETQRMEREISDGAYQDGIRTYKEGIEHYKNNITRDQE